MLGLLHAPKNLVVTYKTCIEELGSWYNDKSDEFYFTSTRDEVMELKADFQEDGCVHGQRV